MKIPTTAAVIQAPCQREIEMSFTLEALLGKPIPETSSELKEQPLNVKEAAAPEMIQAIERFFRGANML